MRTLLAFLFIAILCIYSCDDGDIIVTDFDFDEINLDLCEVTKDDFIYFKINNDTREGGSFNFTKSGFDEKTVGEFEIDVNGENQFTYRRYNIAINQDYYCGTLPPSNINVEEEFVSSSGTAIITTRITNEDDGDGVEEPIDDSIDTDEDGIPNYKDQDDDNDNILTSAELGENGAFLFTDDDEIPDHLDPDDDGDGIPTRLEDIDGNSDPRNDVVANTTNPDALPNYLNPLATETVSAELEAGIKFKKNSVQTEFTTTIIFKDLILDGLDQSIIERNLSLFGNRVMSESITN